jgi:hypothetical protein
LLKPVNQLFEVVLPADLRRTGLRALVTADACHGLCARAPGGRGAHHGRERWETDGDSEREAVANPDVAMKTTVAGTSRSPCLRQPPTCGCVSGITR